MNADLPSKTPAFVFDHERLDAYNLSLEWLAVSEEIAKLLPRGRGPLADQLRRASAGIPLTIAEGVPRRGADRARFYVMAKGSTAECASILDVIETCKLSQADLTRRGRGLLHRLAQTLIGLERQARSRS
jgi:four helix bundle protein